MAATAADFVKTTIQKNAVAVFSKSYCPYCTKAKRALASVGVSAADLHVVELDARDDGGAIQSALSFTGATSVPRVFIGGKFIGGGDDTAAAAASGELKKLLLAAGVSLK